MKRVVVHIDRLVLTGFRHADRHAIAEGLREELARLFADREIVSRFSQMGDASHLKLGGVTIEPGAKPRRVGEIVARGIGNEIRK